MKRWISLMIAANLATGSATQMIRMPGAMAQQDDDLNKIFEEDMADEPPPPDEIPPPVPQPPGNFDNAPPGAGFPPPDNSFNPPPSGGGAPSNSAGGMRGGGGPKGKAAQAGAPLAPKGDLKERFSKAQIEDINNDNFPETIESFDFPNADIKDVVKAISELTGKNFIIDAGLNGRVTIMAPSKITVAEAYKAFLSALAGIGYTIVPSGKFLKIKSARNAQRDSIETYTGAYFPDADVMITRIVQLKHTSAEEINKRLRILPTKDGEMTPYEPTNSLIIHDFGSNVERIMKIIREIDKPGFEEQLAVIPIKYAKAEKIADLVNQIINKTPGGSQGAGGFRAGVPSFRSRVGPGGPGSGAPEELSIVSPDERTNAIIVLGTKPGIDKVRDLVKKLDYRLDPSESAGVQVYYVKNGEAEKLATTLQGITSDKGAGAGGGGAVPGGFGQPSATRPFLAAEAKSVFGGDVKITADKASNSLIITASKVDYETVKSLLNKIDIARDQVFVEAIIMEMNTTKVRDWNPAVYTFKDTGDPKSNALARAGYSKAGTLSSILDPTKDQGAILGFGSGKNLKITLGTTELTVPSLLAFVNFLQTNVEANILSTPRILALDNEDATLEVGEQIPIQEATTTGTGVSSLSTKYEKATLKLEITPFISPDSESVRMKITQSIKQANSRNVIGQGGQSLIAFDDRSLKSNIIVDSGDTAVLGGLVRDAETVSESKIPLLGDIPILGWLFKSNRKDKNKANLLVFLTPKIIRNKADASRLVTDKANERIEWLKENFDGRDPYGKKIESLPRASAATDGPIDAGDDEDLDLEDAEPPARKTNK